MNRRQTVLSLMRVAGYHGDSKKFIRLLVENRISRQVAQAEFLKGQKQKAAGARCECWQCNKPG